jgi:hypothetical protein
MALPSRSGVYSLLPCLSLLCDGLMTCFVFWNTAAVMYKVLDWASGDILVSALFFLGCCPNVNREMYRGDVA